MRATLLVLAACAACGRVGFDEMSDGRSPTGPATATIRTFGNRGEPAVGATVWSSHLDGSVLAVTTTDAEGSAILEIEPGASVSALQMRSLPQVFPQFDVRASERRNRARQNASEC